MKNNSVIAVIVIALLIGRLSSQDLTTSEISEYLELDARIENKREAMQWVSNNPDFTSPEIEQALLTILYDATPLTRVADDVATGEYWRGALRILIQRNPDFHGDNRPPQTLEKRDAFLRWWIESGRATPHEVLVAYRKREAELTAEGGGKVQDLVSEAEPAEVRGSDGEASELGVETTPTGGISTGSKSNHETLHGQEAVAEKAFIDQDGVVAMKSGTRPTSPQNWWLWLGVVLLAAGVAWWLWKSKVRRSS